MASGAAHLDRFVRAVRGRLVLIRMAERVGICLAVACGAVLALMPILLWRGDPAMTAALVALGLGLLSGLFWAAGVRVIPIAAAAEADRQLGQHDLIATAYAVRDSADPWALAVLSLADARCRGLSPGALMLHKLGGRAWGGIGLAAALVLTLGFLSSGPADSRADPWAAVAIERSMSPDASQRKSGSGDVLQEQAAMLRPGGDAPADEGSERSGPQDSSALDPRARSSSDTKPPAAGNSTPTPGDPAGVATGVGRTSASIPRSSEVPSATGLTSTSDRGASAGGLGPRDPLNSGTLGSNHTLTALQSPSFRAVPSWRSSDWSLVKQSAQKELTTGRIDPAYQDVVRDYFDRP